MYTLCLRNTINTIGTTTNTNISPTINIHISTSINIITSIITATSTTAITTPTALLQEGCSKTAVKLQHPDSTTSARALAHSLWRRARVVGRSLARS